MKIESLTLELNIRVYNSFRDFKCNTPHSKVTITAQTEINHETSFIMVHSELDADVFENVLGFLGPMDLIRPRSVRTAKHYIDDRT